MAVAQSQDQPLSGHWAGRLYQFGGPASTPIAIFQYSLDLTESGSSISGTARIDYNSYYAVMELSGSSSDGKLYLTETKTLDTNTESGLGWYFVPKSLDLNVIGTSPQVLEGTWTCYNCDAPPGSVFLLKSGISNTPAVQQYNSPPSSGGNFARAYMGAYNPVNTPTIIVGKGSNGYGVPGYNGVPSIGIGGNGGIAT